MGTGLPYNAGMSRARTWIVVVGLGIIAVVALRMTVFKPRVVPVRVAQVTRGAVEATVSNTRAGTVKVRLRAKLSPQVGGLVVALPHRKGSRVKKGELLLKLDDRTQRAQLDIAERQLAASRKRADDACFAADLAAKDLVRTQGLYAKGIASDQQLDAARTGRDRTRAGCEAARAEVTAAQAQVEAAKVALSLTGLDAPFDGVVAQVSTELGEWITPSPPGVPIPPVIDLLDPSSIYISAPIDEVDSERVHVGQRVRLSFDSRPGRHFAGHVTRVAPYVEDKLEQNRTVTVEAELDDPAAARGLLPGTSADMDIIIARRDNVLRVPTSAVAEGGTVLVLQDGRLAEKKIKTGLSDWQLTEVLSGLKSGDLVVTARDSTAIKAGARARAVSAHD